MHGERALIKAGIYFSKTRLKEGTIFFKHIAEGTISELDLSILEDDDEMKEEDDEEGEEEDVYVDEEEVDVEA